MNRAQLFINKLLSVFKQKTSEIYGADWLSIIIGKVNKDEYYQGIVFSCVDLIAKKASAVPFVLVQKQKDDRSLILDDDDKIIDNHPIIDLLSKPNIRHTWSSFSYLLYSYIALHGESFILPNTSMSGNKLKELFLLNPLNMAIDKGYSNYEPIKKYRYSGGGVSKEYNPEEIVPIIQPNPYDDLRGVSPIQMAKYDIEGEILAKKWNSKFYENGGSPSGIFKIATNDANVFKNVEKEIKSKYTGIDNAFKMFILNKDSDFKNITPSQRDMDFVKQQEMSEKRIHKVFKVPDIFLGDAESAKYSNAEVAKRIFGETVILPLLTITFDSLNTFLLPKVSGNEDVKLKFHNPVPEDRDYLLKKQETDRKDTETSLNYMTINEIRETKKLKPLPGGDVLIDEFLKDEPVPSDDNPEDDTESKSVIKSTQGDKYEKLRNVFVKKNEKKYSNKLKAHFGKLYLAIKLNQYSKSKKKGKKQEPEDYEVDQYLNKIVPDTEQWRIDLAEILVLFGILAIDNSIDNVSETFKLVVDFNLVHEDAVKWLKNRAAQAATSVRDSMLNRAREVIARNLSQDVVDIQKIKEELLKIFIDEEDWRIERIYRTEMMNAYAKGSVQSYLSAGLKKHQWLTKDPCPVCLLNNLEIRNIGEPFPSGHTEPTVHPNCMCTTSPVIES